MSSNPVSFRYPFETEISALPSEVQQVHRNEWNKMVSLTQALQALNTKVEGVKSAAASNASAIENITNNSETIIEQVVSAIGFVNNQVGVTAYTTVPSDQGAFIIFNDASPIAVTLSTLGSGGGISLPWYCAILNFGAGLVTLTPASGTITYPNNLAAATMPIAQGNAVSVVYDGTNFWGFTIPVPPQTIAAVTSKWLNSYTESTGLFTATQPAFSDLSGQIAPSTQMPASGVTAGSYTLSSVTVNAEGLVTAAASGPTGLSVTITTAKLTTLGANGSMTYTAGILTAQTPAT
jgi:hypothetical protein